MQVLPDRAIYPSSNGADATGMKPRVVEETRLINMRAIAKRVGGITAMAEKIEKAQPQWQNTIGKTPKKAIGSDVAREVEEKFDLGRGWVDMPWDMLVDEAPSQPPRLDDEIVVEASKQASHSDADTAAIKAFVLAYEFIVLNRARKLASESSVVPHFLQIRSIPLPSSSVATILPPHGIPGNGACPTVADREVGHEKNKLPLGIDSKLPVR